jgi:hypothetical protein
MRKPFLALLLVAGCGLGAAPPETRACAAKPGTRCVVAGPEYGAGPIRSALLGRGYRELWTEPVEVPVLDLERAGDLRPVEVLGHVQSRSLALAAADGRAFTFRSADKDASRLVTGPLRLVPGAVRAYRDQTSAGFPAAPIVAAPIARAAGVLESDVRLGVMPDDPRLEAFGAEFAGRLGTLEEYATPAADGRAGTFGAREIVETSELWERLERDPAERVDTPAYLRARLVDLVLGDVDRHAGQWRWARLEPEGAWLPIAQDRDLAFVRFGGALLRVSRPWFPLIVSFGEGFEPRAMGHQSRSSDRRLLGNLDRAAWRRETAAVQARLEPRVIDEAVARLPTRWRELEGARLTATLRWRVDHLEAGADGLYELLAERVEVWGTGAPEELTARPLDDGRLEVSVTAVGAGRPRYRRILEPSETDAVRVCDFDAADRLVLGAAAEHPIEIRTQESCEMLPPTIAPGAKDSEGGA